MPRYFNTVKLATASKQQVARHIVPLVEKLSPTSINQYLNIVCILHVEQGYGDPLQSYYITSLLQGIKCEHAAPPNQKRPIASKLVMSLYNCWI